MKVVFCPANGVHHTPSNDGRLDFSAVHSDDEDTESVELRNRSHHDLDEEHDARRPTVVGVD